MLNYLDPNYRLNIQFPMENQIKKNSQFKIELGKRLEKHLKEPKEMTSRKSIAVSKMDTNDKTSKYL